MRLIAASCLGFVMASAQAGLAQEAKAASRNFRGETGPGFEVATVRAAKPEGDQRFGFTLLPSGKFTVTSVSLHNLVVLAYGKKPGFGDVTGGPDWVNSVNYDINAKVDPAYMGDWEKLSSSARYDRVWPMLGSLLVERFHLRLRTEEHAMPVYALVQAKNGAKLKEVATPPPETAQEQEARARGEVKTAMPGGWKRTGNTFTGEAAEMATIRGLIAMIGGADRLIIDESGLKGSYAFSFKMPQETDGTSVLEEVEKQLGLKLEARKVMMTTYVIENAVKPSLDGAQ